MTIKVKEQIGFLCLLIEMQLYILISLELNIFLKKNLKKSKKNQLLTIYLEYKNEPTICRFYFIAFVKYILAGKTLLDYTNLFSPNNYKKNDIIIYILKINMIEEASLEI